jgi:predicted metal-dependent hydrolase
LSKLAFECEGLSVEPVVIQSSRRKTASLEVKNGELKVRVPKGTPEHWIQQFIMQRHDWIVQHISAQLDRQQNYQVNPYKTACVPFLGENIPLNIREVSEKSSISFSQDRFDINLNRRISRDPEIVTNELLQAWLVGAAKDHLIPRTHMLSQKMNLLPVTIDIGNFKSMWGRCSAKGDIALNWRLILAEPDAIDYVIIHEICHLQEFNHSAAFWKKVGGYCSDTQVWRHYFKERSVWLSWR